MNCDYCAANGIITPAEIECGPVCTTLNGLLLKYPRRARLCKCCYENVGDMYAPTETEMEVVCVDRVNNEQLSKVVMFTGTPSGDGECFCWDVDEETYRRVMGEKDYLWEKEFRKNSAKELGMDLAENHLWRIYPGSSSVIDKNAREFVIISILPEEEDK